MGTHFNRYSSGCYDFLQPSSLSRVKNQEFGTTKYNNMKAVHQFTVKEKMNGGNQHLQENGEKFKTLNYWGKVRKSAVRSDPTILQPKNSEQEDETFDGKIKKEVLMNEKGSQMGKNFLGLKGEIGNACQVFDERDQREKTGKNSLNSAKSGKKYVGAMRTDTVGVKQKVGCDNTVFNVGEERKKLLYEFRSICKSLAKQKGKLYMRIDSIAYDELKQSGQLFLNENKPGPVAGVEVGDHFKYRVELVIMGIHSSSIRGIDYHETADGKVLATSIVATEGYGDCMKADELMYTGEGGIYECGNNRGPKDQELKRGNLALMNSMKEGNYVRVVRGIKSNEGNKNMKSSTTTFVYDGLYKVVDIGKKIGGNGKLQYEFKLKRCPGQKAIVWEKFK